MNKEIEKKIEEKLAQAYCDKECSDKVLDATLIKVMAEKLVPLYTSMVEGELRKIAKEVGGMAFDKEKSDITQEYQSTFLDGYNQAIEEVQQYLLERKKK